jgi:hypothetical protein
LRVTPAPAVAAFAAAISNCSLSGCRSIPFQYNQRLRKSDFGGAAGRWISARQAFHRRASWKNAGNLRETQSMIQHELLSEQRILILRPEAALRSEDFAKISRVVDPFIESHGDLRGVMIDAPSFPGWENFAALLSHLRFVRDHHRRIRRVAVVSGHPLLSVAPKIANHFLNAELKTFGPADRAAALAWLGEGG